MRSAFVGVLGLCAVVVCVACSQSLSPTTPSSVRPTALSADTAAGVTTTDVSSIAYDQAARQVPFKGELAGTSALTPLQPPFASVTVSAAGNGTHLGRFTLEIPHTVNFVTQSAEGTMTFTAANGDTVTAVFTGQLQLGPIESVIEHATITGGTGRFVGATGSFTMHRLLDPVAGTTTGSFDGTISPPGQN
jgi:hypothetical protein